MAALSQGLLIKGPTGSRGVKLFRIVRESLSPCHRWNELPGAPPKVWHSPLSGFLSAPLYALFPSLAHREEMVYHLSGG